MAIIASALSVGASTASAADNPYCGLLTAPRSQCSQSLSGVFRANVAQYTGAGTVSVCERADSDIYGELSRVCGNNSVGSDADLLTAWSYNWWITLKVGNNSDNNHTINGHGYNP